MLTIDGLSVTYGSVSALADLSFSCVRGEIITIIGPSGCGKTSLLNVLAGNVSGIGKVQLSGGALDHRRMSIGLVAQDYGLLPWRTVYGNVVLPLIIKKKKPARCAEKIGYLMERLQLADLTKRYPGQLSGGQKQRVAIAKAFVMDLDLLLLDEPFSALDAITREQTQQLFLDIWQAHKPITLLVTHSIEEAVVLGTRIVVLSHAPGRIVSVFDNPTFGLANPHSNPQFHSLCNTLRQLVLAQWQ